MVGKGGLFGLNPAQRAAVEQIEGPVLILAGAGTGKTRVITTRIAFMLAREIPATDILAVTFTNKAANEMRERVTGMVSDGEADDVTVATFHSMCVRILRASIELLGYKKNFSIYTQSDQMGLLKKIIVRKAAKDEKIDAKVVQSAISNSKNMGIPVDDDPDSLIAEVYRAYQRELKSLNAVDFDDLMLLAVEVLEKHPEARLFWKDRFKYIMVDEFQDTNHLQMTLLKLLVGPAQNICVVGDDDQSIYGWRGADITNILEFERFFPNPKIIKLEENYRSNNTILRLANSVIRHNLTRREKTLWSSKGDGERVRIMAMPDSQTEAEAVINEIRDSHRMRNKAYEDMAVLFRTNTQSRIFEHQFREAEVPYRLIGGQSFYERREVKDLMSYLALFTNPADDVSLLRVIATPPRGIGEGTIAMATEYSIAKDMSIYDTIQEPDFLINLSNRASGALDRFVTFVNEFSDVATTKSADYATMTEELCKELDYNEYVKRTCKNADEANMRLKNIHELVESMHDYRAKRPKKSLKGFLDAAALSSDREKKDEDTSGVSLITMHASKGLEFPICYVVGCEEGILPHSRSVEEDTLDEERRIMYVAITRAKEELTISWCKSRVKWGDKIPCSPSSFFKEMSEDEIEKISWDELAEEVATEEVADDYFARMKEMLSNM